MWQLLDGVRYMHRKGYIHRDIKLGNLFIDRKMDLKIGDFGLAAQIEHDGERKKTICGTPNYIAPEILFDTKNGHSFEVDIWSLGVVMYTFLIGKPPFQTKEVKAIYKNIRDNVYAFPEDIKISDDAKGIITAFLHPKPQHRPSIDDVMEHSYFSHRPISIPLSALKQKPTFGSSSKESSPELKPSLSTSWRSPRATDTIAKGPPLPPRPPLSTKNEPNTNVSLSPKVVLKSPPVLIRSPATTRPSPTTVATPDKPSPLRYDNLYSPSNDENASPSLTRSQRKSSTGSRHSGRFSVNLYEIGKPAGNVLEEMYTNLKEGLESFHNPIQSINMQMEDLQSDGTRVFFYIFVALPDPSVFITKWIDYTNKYGLSYQLRDGSVGVYFNDSTSIILSPNDE